MGQTSIGCLHLLERKERMYTKVVVQVNITISSVKCMLQEYDDIFCIFCNMVMGSVDVDSPNKLTHADSESSTRKVS